MKKIFILYTIIILFLILFKFSFTFNDITEYIRTFRSSDYEKVNLVLFKTIKIQIKDLNYWSITNLLVNTLPFFIMGVLYTVSFKSKIIINMLVISLIVLFIELTQLIFIIGTFDIDDIFLNIIFGIFGIMISKLIIKRVKWFNHITTT